MLSRTSFLIRLIFGAGGSLGLPIFLFSSSALAFTPEVQKVTEMAEREVLTFEGEKAIQEISEFRNEVRASAKIQTLKLCEGYRRALGYGPAEYHGQYKYTLEDSLDAWATVLIHGLRSPLDTKANDFKRLHGYGHSADQGLIGRARSFIGAGNKGVENWFNSLYALYLIDSLGFLNGAMHCLNTMDQRQIHYFAAAILTADREAALGSYVGQTLAGGAVMKAISKAATFAWSPAQRVVSLLTAKIPNSAYYIVGTAAAGLVASQLYPLIVDAELKREKAQDIISERLDPGRLKRADLASGIYGRIRVIVLADREAKLKSKTCGTCRTLQLEMMDHIRREISYADFDAMAKDESFLERNLSNLNAADEFYLGVLRVVLPVLRNLPPAAFATK